MGLGGLRKAHGVAAHLSIEEATQRLPATLAERGLNEPDDVRGEEVAVRGIWSTCIEGEAGVSGRHYFHISRCRPATS
jgi:hypothetical protein